MEPSKEKKGLADSLQSVWSQALLAVNSAETEASSLVSKLQSSAQLSQDEVRKQVRELADRLTHQRRDIERRVEEGVRLTLQRVRVPRREEIAGLNARLDTLNRRIDNLLK